MRIIITTVLAITAPFLLLADSTPPESEALIEKWIQGYLFDFYQQVKFIEERNQPMVVETYDYAKKKTKTIEAVVEDQELISDIIKLVLEDVDLKAREQNWIGEAGSVQGTRTLRSHVRPQIRLKWYIEGMIVGLQFDANGVEIYHKIDSKKAQVHYQKRSCSEDLGLRIKDKLQPGASHNGGKPPRES